MSVHRVMGIETEYGISVPGHPHVNAMTTSSAVVTSYTGIAVGDRRSRARWDFDEEHPLRDARGYDMSRAEADPSQLTDEDLGLANLILTNGARLYVDHAHPEFSSPEVTNPLDAVLWDRAGMEIMADAAEAATRSGPFTIQLYKNNTDNKGASYGCHENYLMRRATPFVDIVRDLTPFFVTRQVFAGAGRVGRGQEGREPGFQLSQRADFFEVEVGLETTLKRPIINTRDEPHADPERHRRLHVIVGDANLAEAATYLKMGSTSLVLALIEAGGLREDLVLADPVREIHAVSHDPSLTHRLTLRDGRRMTALEIQRAYLEAAADLAEKQAIAGVWKVIDEAITGSLPAQQATIGSPPHDWIQLCGGSIGNGLPLAVGAALGAPGRKVICLEGDGSAMYTAQALWTMARERLDVISIIYANRNYAILNFELERVGAGTPGARARSMLNIGNPALDWVSLACGMGVDGVRVDTAEALDAALARMVAEPGPHLVDAVF